MKDVLGANPCPIVVPIGAEESFKGLVDLIKMKAIYWHDETMGADYSVEEIPAELVDEANEWRDKTVSYTHLKLADKALLPKIDDEFESKVADLKRILVKKLMTLTEGKVSQGVKDYLGAEVIAKGSKFSASDFDSLDFTSIQLSNWTSDDHINGMIRDLVMNFIKKYKELDAELKRKKFAITIGDELPAGIIQMAKVYIAKKRKIGVGDKMAGRHGNKGIVSRVVRQEDMPFLADGTPVDIVLNPLGEMCIRDSIKGS